MGSKFSYDTTSSATSTPQRGIDESSASVKFHDRRGRVSPDSCCYSKSGSLEASPDRAGSGRTRKPRMAGYAGYGRQERGGPRAVAANASGLGELGLLDDLFLEARGHLLVLEEFHAETPLALSHASQVVGVAEHLGERHFRGDDRVTSP